MSPTAIALILVAAIAHATWNLLSKQASATGAVSFIWLVSATATAGYAPVIAIAVIIGQPRLTGLCWLFMAGTGLLQAGYFLFLQNGYRLGATRNYRIHRRLKLHLRCDHRILLRLHQGVSGIAG